MDKYTLLRVNVEFAQMVESLVSVIMPVYNCQEYISYAIDSVLNQTYITWELYIIDDCSTDKSLEIAEHYLKKDLRISVFSNPHRMGIAFSRIYGARQCHGSYIAFIDSDDLWDSRKLEIQMKEVGTSGKAGERAFIFCASRFIRNLDRKLDFILHVPQNVSYRRLLKQDIISTSSVLIDRQLFLEYAAEPEHQCAEDFYWWLTIEKNGYCAKGIDIPLITYRLTGRSASCNKFRQIGKVINTYRAVGLNPVQCLFYLCCWTVLGLKKYAAIGLKGPAA